MPASILLARGDALLSIPQSEFDRHLAVAPERHRQRQAFMSGAHHRVRYFVVQALARTGRPLGPQSIARQLSLPESAVRSILADLERNLLFLVRNAAGEVSWAFPLTVEPTPHRITLSSGEAIFGA